MSDLRLLQSSTRVYHTELEAPHMGEIKGWFVRMAVVCLVACVLVVLAWALSVPSPVSAGLMTRIVAQKPSQIINHHNPSIPVPPVSRPEGSPVRFHANPIKEHNGRNTATKATKPIQSQLSPDGPNLRGQASSTPQSSAHAPVDGSIIWPVIPLALIAVAIIAHIVKVRSPSNYTIPHLAMMLVHGQELKNKHAQALASLRRLLLPLVVCAAAGLLLPEVARASTAEKLVEATRGKVSDWAVPFLLAMLPIVELRGAIPFGIVGLGLDPATVFVLAVLGNMMPVPALLLGVKPLASWASARSDMLKRFFEWLFERSRNKAAGWKEHEFAAVVAFVGVPLPGTGAWSGSLGCFVLGMPFWKALAANFFGVVVAAAIVTEITVVGQWGWQSSAHAPVDISTIWPVIALALIAVAAIAHTLKVRSQSNSGGGGGLMTASLSAPHSSQPAWLDQWLSALPAPAGDLAVVQQRGRAALAELPVPSSCQEDWRFTSLALLQSLPLQVQQHNSTAIHALPEPEPGVLRLVLNGVSDPLDDVVLPDGLQRLSAVEVAQGLGHTLAATGCERHWPVELNHAAASRVLALRVSACAQLKLELVSAAGGGLLPLRLLLVLEEKAQLELAQLITAEAAGLTSLVLEAHLARSARLRHGLVSLGHSQAALMAHMAIEQEPDSELALSSITAGWGLARLEPRIVQVDGQASTTLRALQLVAGRQIADTHSSVLFAGPAGQLDQLHKAVAAGQGRSVFNGAVQVPRAAQRTNAAQLSRNLLLSDRARIDTKPQLEIVADDVICAHGATVSSPQSDEIFYLQSRGIDAEQAAGMLQRAFCEEVLRELPTGARTWCPVETLQMEAT